MGRCVWLRKAALLIALACLWGASGCGAAMAEAPAEGRGQVVAEEVTRIYRGPSGVTTLPTTPAPAGDGGDAGQAQAAFDDQADAPEAADPILSDDIAVTLALSPAQLAAPGEVGITFTLENRSEYGAQNVVISTDELPGARFTEFVGSIAPGETQTLSRTHAVTQAELDEGRLTFFVSYESAREGNPLQGCRATAGIDRLDAQPRVDFTRRLSSAFADPARPLTVVYHLHNAGNVALTDLSLTDGLGGFSTRLEQLAVGETRNFVSHVDIDQDAVSEPSLTYASPDGTRHTLALDAVTIPLIRSEIKASFSVSTSMLDADTADATLTLVNNGNAAVTDVIVTDAVYGGLIADALVLPPDGTPVRVTSTYPLRDDESRYQWQVSGIDGAGGEIHIDTESATLKRDKRPAHIAAELSATARTPEINRAGDVTFDITITNPGNEMARDCLLYEVNHQQIRRLAVLPAGEPVTLPVTYRVREDAQFIFCLNYTDAEGKKRAVSTAPIDVRITPGGVTPEDAQAAEPLSGGSSIKFGSSRSFWILVGTATAALLVMTSLLIITTMRARQERQRRLAAERQRMKEELGKTNPFTPIKQRKANRTRKRKAP